MTAIRWDDVHSSRETYLTCMWAMCSPGRPIAPLPARGMSDDAIVDAAAAVLTSLLDPGLSLAVVGGEGYWRIAKSVCAATGAAPDELDRADFVLVGNGPEPVADRARRGTARRPQDGATIVYAGTAGYTRATLTGPGLERPTLVEVPLPPEEVHAFVAANVATPAGVDALIMTGRGVVAVPRSTAVAIEGA